MQQKPMTLVFKRDSEKGATWRYKETEPGSVIGGFYMSKLAVYYWFDGKPPEQIRVTVEAFNGKA